MYSVKDDRQEWHVIFTEAKIWHPLFKYLDQEFTHVYAVRSLNDYHWLIVQPTCGNTDISIKYKSEYPRIRLIAGPDAKIITVKAKIKNRFRGGLNWFTCVEQVKALIGIKDFWVFTPKQLYTALMGDKYVKASSASRQTD